MFRLTSESNIREASVEKTINLICNPFESGRSGLSRYMQSVYEALLRNSISRDFVIRAQSKDVTFKKGAAHCEAFPRKPKRILTHFLSERRIYPVAHPFVVMCHDLTPQLWPYRYGYARAFYHKTYVNYFLRKASRVLCPSNAVKRDLIEFVGVNESNVVVVRHGFASASFYSEVNPDLLPKKLAQLKDPFILIVSRLEHPGKNLIFAIDAYRELRKKTAQKIDLVIVGAAWNGYSVIEKAITTSGFAEDIHNLGSVSDENLRRLYSSAALLFFPSVREGFALPVLESLACGTPVVLSRVPVLLEFKEKGLAFFKEQSLSDCIEKILEVLRSSHLRREINLDRAYWSWDRVANEVLDVYDSVFLGD